MRRYAKYLALLALALLGGLLVSGCSGGGSPLPQDKYAEVQAALTDIDAKSQSELKALGDQFDYQITEENKKEKKDATRLAFLKLQRGYVCERVTDAAGEPVQLAKAVSYYHQVNAIYGSVGVMRLAQVDLYRVEQEVAQGNEAQAAVYRQEAVRALEQLSFFTPKAETYIREPGVGFQRATAPGTQWQLVNARNQAIAWLDPYYRTTWQYQILRTLVRVAGGGNASKIIAIFLIAILAKLITTPFSIAQFRSMRAMQLFQPELKKLQEKYKDDKQQLAKAQMELMKEHKVNPASSCLPMIVQLVILWQVYYAIRHFLFQFENVHFLYIPNLANPDTILLGGAQVPGPLLLLYAASMYFTQKLVSMPAATPEQAQQQRMMAIMMPFMMLFIMQSLPAAFILYWFLQNVLMTGHQYLIMRPHRAADAAAAAAHQLTAASTGKEGADTAEAGPPPEALQRLSQGRKSVKKKRKRRY